MKTKQEKGKTQGYKSNNHWNLISDKLGPKWKKLRTTMSKEYQKSIIVLEAGVTN